MSREDLQKRADEAKRKVQDLKHSDGVLAMSAYLEAMIEAAKEDMVRDADNDKIQRIRGFIIYTRQALRDVKSQPAEKRTNIYRA